MAHVLESSPRNNRYTLTSFIEAPSNQVAYRAAQAVLAGSTAMNPLFVHGTTGHGKTHLLQGLTLELLQKRTRAVYLSAGEFRHRPLKASELADALDIVDVLLIDDFDAFASVAVAPAFYSTLLYYINNGSRLVVAADKHPLELSGLTRDLSSRLSMGLVAAIGAMEYELRYKIVMRLLHDARVERPGFTLSEQVVGMLALYRGGNGRSLASMMNRLAAEYSLNPRPFTKGEVRGLVKDILPEPEATRISIEEIQKRVAEHFNTRMTDMASPRRVRSLVRPRQVAMYLAKQLTRRSLPEIGRKFGGRDHTTVMHAIRKVGELMESDPQFAKDVQSLQRELEGE